MPKRKVTEYFKQVKKGQPKRMRPVTRRNLPLAKSIGSNNRPNITTCNLRWCEIFTLNATTMTGPLTWRLRANSVYSPYKTASTVSTRQPIGFDQKAAQYEYFVVNGSKVKVSACWGTSASGGVLQMALGRCSDNSDWGNLRTAVENGAKCVAILPYTSSAKETVLSSTYSARSQYGTTADALRQNGNVTAAVSTNPTFVEDFQILFDAASYGGSYQPGANLAVRMEMEFNVTFFGNKRSMPGDNIP